MIWRAFWKDTRGVKFVQHEFGCGWIRCWHQVVSLMRSRLAAVSRGRLCHGAKNSSYMKTVLRQKPHFEKWSNTHFEKLYQSLTFETKHENSSLALSNSTWSWKNVAISPQIIIKAYTLSIYLFPGRPFIAMLMFKSESAFNWLVTPYRPTFIRPVIDPRHSWI